MNITQTLVGLAFSGLSFVTYGESISDIETQHDGFKLASIPWEPAAKDGTQYALLEGDRETASPFSYAFRIPAGLWDKPHWHSQTARVLVVTGTLSIGYGETIDESRLTHYPAGSLVIVPAGAIHFDGSDEDTIIYGVAQGPWRTEYLDKNHSGSAGTPQHE